MGAVAQPLPRRRLIPVAALAAALLCVLLVVLAAGMMEGLTQSSCAPAAGANSAPSRAALADIPSNYLRWMRQASRRYRLHWSVLAGVYSIESNFGRLKAPGVRSGENYAGAGGPGQFLAATWALYAVDGDGDGAKDRYNPADAIPSSANLLRKSGAPGDYRRAIFAYNHANWYVNDVLARAARYRGAAARDPDALQAPLPPDGAASAACTQLAASAGPADLNTAVRLTAPAAYRALPAWAMATGRPPQQVDARIYGDAVWLLRRYNLRATAAREPGHQTHGDGTALDLVPASATAQRDWDRTAGRLALDLGWTPRCASSGTRPACPLKPAIQFVGYDGYQRHGSPRTCSGGCPAHLHVSWVSACYGSSALVAPCQWVMAFPAPGRDGEDSEQRADAAAAGSPPPPRAAAAT